MQFLFHTSEPPICLIYGELRDKLPQKLSISRMYEPNQNEVIIVYYFGKIREMSLSFHMPEHSPYLRY